MLGVSPVLETGSTFYQGDIMFLFLQILGLVFLLITILMVVKLKIMKVKAAVVKTTPSTCARDLIRFSKAYFSDIPGLDPYLGE